MFLVSFAGATVAFDGRDGAYCASKLGDKSMAESASVRTRARYAIRFVLSLRSHATII